MKWFRRKRNRAAGRGDTRIAVAGYWCCSLCPTSISGLPAADLAVVAAEHHRTEHADTTNGGAGETT